MDTRRYDLDWLRVIVFALLILYHVGMFFVPWGWHIKNNTIFPTLEIPMVFVNQWRLPILFMISGMGTSYALSKRNLQGFMRERSFRLLIPLIAGMILVIPAQVYIERVTGQGYSGTFWQFYLKDYFTHGAYPTGNFSWHHLWFLPYLLLFSLTLGPAFIYLRNNPDNKFTVWARKIWQKPYGTLAYLLPLIIISASLEPFFPRTHFLVGDYHTIAFNLTLFFYGYLFISFGKAFWQTVEKVRKKALLSGIPAFIFFVFVLYLPEGTFKSIFYVFAKLFNMGCWLLVLIGYAAKYLNKPGRNIRYWNQAVYPFYIFHQTVTIVLAYYIYDTQWNAFVKFLFLTVFTFLISWVLFECARRFRLTCFLFGIKEKKREKIKTSVVLTGT